jgi:hypothetical protein
MQSINDSAGDVISQGEAVVLLARKWMTSPGPVRSPAPNLVHNSSCKQASAAVSVGLATATAGEAPASSWAGERHSLLVLSFGGCTWCTQYKRVAGTAKGVHAVLYIAL